MDTVFTAPMLPSPTPPTPTTSPTPPYTDLTDAADPTKPGIEMRMCMRCARPALSRKARRAWLTAGADSLHSVAQPTQNLRSHDHPTSLLPHPSASLSWCFLMALMGTSAPVKGSKTSMPRPTGMCRMAKCSPPWTTLNSFVSSRARVLLVMASYPFQALANQPNPFAFRRGPGRPGRGPASHPSRALA